MSVSTQIEYLSKMYPRMDWTTEVHEAFWRRVHKLSLSTEQVKAVIDEYRCTARNATPVPSDLLKMMRVATGREHAKTKKVRVSDDVGPQPHPNPVSREEWGKRGGDAWLEKCREQRCTCPLHESVIARKPHPLGGQACEACGGCITGKWLHMQREKHEGRLEAVRRRVENDALRRKYAQDGDAIIKRQEPMEGQREAARISRRQDDENLELI